MRIAIGRRAGLLGAATALAAPRIARAAPAPWVAYSSSVSPDNANVRGLLRLADRLREATGGEVSLTVRTAGTLPIRATEISAAVVAGRVAIGDDSFIADILPRAGVLRLPMLAITPDAWAATVAAVRDNLADACQARGVTLLGIYRTPLQMSWSRLRMAALFDIERQRMRIASNAQIEMAIRLGGQAIPLSMLEIPGALQSKRIDGLFAAASGAAAWKDQLKFASRSGPSYFDGMLVASPPAMAALSASARDAVLQEANETCAWIVGAMDSDETAAQAAVIASGTAIAPSDPADIDKATAKLTAYWDEWATTWGRGARSVLSSARQALGR